MINRKYIVQDGEFEEENNNFIFHGSEVVLNEGDPEKEVHRVSTGMLLFSGISRDGVYKYKIKFKNVTTETRFGVVLDYKNVDGMMSFCEAGLRNQLTLYEFSNFDGEKWDFLLSTGFGSKIIAEKEYSIRVEVQGSILKLFVENICAYIYTKYMGGFNTNGIYITNSDDAEISDIEFEDRQHTAFIIMKFEKDFDDLYRDVICPRCRENNYSPVRADEICTSSSIIQDIIHEISQASLVIADITMDNANVFYELGYAHALHKPVILLADMAKREKLPFDISGYRTIFYNNTISGKHQIEQQLDKYIKYMSNRAF